MQSKGGEESDRKTKIIIITIKRASNKSKINIHSFGNISQFQSNDESVSPFLRKNRGEMITTSQKSTRSSS